MALATTVGLSAFTMVGLNNPLNTSPKTASAKTEEYIKIDGYNYTKNQVEMFNEVNRWRVLTGARKVKLDPKIAKAAENHSRYVCYNGEYTAPFHEQKKGKKYFTGKTVKDRFNYVGYKNPMPEFYDTMEIYQVAKSDKKYVEDVVRNTVYHRLALLSNAIHSIGPSKSDCVATIDGSEGYLNVAELEKESSRLVAYPYPNQTNVDESSDKFVEYPMPDEAFDIPTTQTKGPYITWQSFFEFDRNKPRSMGLYDDKGKKVKISEPKYSENYRDGFIVPDRPLKYSTKYTMKVSFYQEKGWELEGYPDKINFEWSFTTRANPIKPHPTKTIGHIKAKSGSNLQVYTSSGKKQKVITSSSAPLPITKVTSYAYYLKDKSYVKKSSGANYYIGKLAINKTIKSVNVSTGKYYKTYKKGTTVKIVKYVPKKGYYLSNSEYIKNSPSSVKYFAAKK